MTNIKERMLAINKPKCKAFGSIADPLMEEIADVDTFVNLSRDMGYVPYYQDGDRALSLFKKLRRFSPTHGAIINSQKRFATGQGVGVAVNEDESEDFTEFLNSWARSQDAEAGEFDLLDNVAEQIHDNLKTYGNAYLEVVVTTIAGEKFVTFKIHDADKCRYLADGMMNFEVILISPVWSRAYLSKHHPAPLPVYPMFTDEQGGMIQRTIIHVKNETLGREIYGEMDSLSGLYFHYLGLQLGAYTVEGYDSEWVAQFFIETVGDPEDDTDTDGFDEAMAQTFSRKGTERKRVMHRHRGRDTEPTKIHEFAKNSDHDFHKTMGEIADSRTFKAHDWHPVLMESTAGSLGQGNEFNNVFKAKYHTVIKPQQRKINKVLNKLVRIVADVFDYELPKGAKLELRQPFPELLNEKQKVTPQQMQSVTDVLVKVNTGEISKDSAKGILAWAYQIPTETIDQILQ